MSNFSAAAAAGRGRGLGRDRSRHAHQACRLRNFTPHASSFSTASFFLDMRGLGPVTLWLWNSTNRSAWFPLAT